MKIGVTPVTVIMGRFQPPTKGHMRIVRQAKKIGNPIVMVVVRGAKTKFELSPFSLDVQKEMFNEILPVGSMIIDTPSGFIGDFVDELREMNLEPTVIVAGSDRKKTYETQINRYEQTLNLNLKVKEVKRQEKDVSATKARIALKLGDEKEFQKLMPKKLHRFFATLRKTLQCQ